jgi:ribosomal protein S7
MIKNNLFNQAILNGNKYRSEKLIRKSIKKVQKVTNKKNFKELFKISLMNSSPIFYIKTIKRKRRQTTEFPFVLPKNLRLSYGLKFILKYCNDIKASSFYLKLNNEIIESAKKNSQSFKHTEHLYKESLIKKKFSSYRWF